jgi:hypothetical protein
VQRFNVALLPASGWALMVMFSVEEALGQGAAPAMV